MSLKNRAYGTILACSQPLMWKQKSEIHILLSQLCIIVYRSDGSIKNAFLVIEYSLLITMQSASPGHSVSIICIIFVIKIYFNELFSFHMHLLWNLSCTPTIGERDSLLLVVLFTTRKVVISNSYIAQVCSSKQTEPEGTAIEDNRGFCEGGL